MYKFDLEEFEEVVKNLMKQEFGSVQDAVKIPIAINDRIYIKATKFLREKYGYLVVDPKDSITFTKAVQEAYKNTVNKIIRES